MSPTDSQLLYSHPQCAVFLVRPTAEVDVAVQGVLPTGNNAHTHHAVEYISTCEFNSQADKIFGLLCCYA